MSREGVRRDVESFLDMLRQEDPSLNVHMEFEEGRLGWGDGMEIPADSPLVLAALQASEEILHARPELWGFPGATNGNTFQNEGGIPSLPAFGPGLLPLAHMPNEHISVEGIVQAAKVYALTALYYCCDSFPGQA
jgi:acetylornithine deacetylase